MHGRVAVGVPRWAVVAAYAAALTVLPSGVWRILFVNAQLPLLDRAGTLPARHGPVMFDGWWYPVALTVVSELLAFLAVGLVATWGEVVPGWVPWLGGRRIPVAVAAVPAALGAAFLTVLWAYALVMLGLGRMVDGTEGTGVRTHGWQTVVFVLCYAPLAAWGPLLGAVTVQYVRRRR